MKVMITGITGFAGRHLVELLMEMEGLDIYGIRRWEQTLRDLLDYWRKVIANEQDA